MHFSIAACLWTDHFILLKALDHLFSAEQKKTCRSDQVQEAKGQYQGWGPLELAACFKGWGSRSRALLGDNFSLKVVWIGGTESGRSAGQPRARSDTEALHEGAGTPGFFLFTFFCYNQSLTTAGAQTPGGMNNCYKGLKQSHGLTPCSLTGSGLHWSPGSWLVGVFFNNKCLQNQRAGEQVSWLLQQISPDYQE